MNKDDRAGHEHGPARNEEGVQEDRPEQDRGSAGRHGGHDGAGAGGPGHHGPHLWHAGR